MHRPTTSMMKTEEKIKAVRNRDASYRDKFFVAVRTTKIVCTPDCPAKPLEKNIVFYDTLEEALQAGYRPCKICMKEFPNNKRNNMETIKITRYQSPVGDMLVGSYGDKLCICDWAVEKRRSTIDRRIQRHLSTKKELPTSSNGPLGNSKNILPDTVRYSTSPLSLPVRNFNVLYGKN